MIKITMVVTTYPAPADDEEDYCPDGKADVTEHEVGFRELVRMLSDYRHPSCWPASGGVREWLTNEASQDYRTGAWAENSIHFSHENAPRYAKYWRAAWRAAGII